MKFFLQYSKTRDEFSVAYIAGSIKHVHHIFLFDFITIIKINKKKVYFHKYRKNYILKNFKNITYIKLNEFNTEIYLKNTYLHNTTTYAFNILDDYHYFINGKQYYKNDFPQHPEVIRNERINKLKFI